MNEVTIIGTISAPQFDHEVNGERIYKTYITSRRTSGATDVIPVLLPQYLCNNINPKVMITGEFRSHNTEADENGRKHLVLYLYAQNIYDMKTERDDNQITLQGYVCKTPVTRKTPGGRTITDLLIATPRSNISDRSDYIPVIVWGEHEELEIGNKVTLTGRIQSRIYKENKTALEVSTSKLTKQN